MSVKIIGEVIHEMPWQDRPEGNQMPMWRYSKNPIIGRNPAPGVARVFNSAAVKYGDKYIAVLRAETVNGRPHLSMGYSDNGIDWQVESERIEMRDENGELYYPNYAYDPRLIKVEDTYYIIWCTDFKGAALGMAKTEDFKTFTRIENPFIPFNRNGVLFPRKINGMYKLLSRPSDSGHTPFGDIFVSESPDMVYWGKHRHVMGAGGSGWWQSTKIGGGPAPIETTEGWLLIYHGVTGTCNGFVYSIGGAILDINEPSKVLYRCKNYLMTPEEWYEERGFVNNVLFPCATIHDAQSGRIAIYYGAADTYVGLAFTTVEEVVTYIKENTEVIGDEGKDGRI